ncbi:hypothetical protein JCM1841_006056 [Sporobolomyces salmonicolor]
MTSSGPLGSLSPVPYSRTRKKPPGSLARTGSTSSPSKRAARIDPLEGWSTEEDEGGGHVRPHRPPKRPESWPKRPPPRSWPFRALVSTTTRLVGSLLAPLLPYVAFAALLYLTVAYARSYLYSQLSPYLAVVPSFLRGPISRLANLPLPIPHLSLAPLSSMSCALFGFHCPPNFHLVSGAARTATVRAQHALTIFDHLIELGREDSAGMGLHPVECWELATAVRYSSSLDDREFISSELGELGDLTREVKDSVIGLNAQGINAFVWIVHEFSRLEELITRAAQSSSHSSPRQQAELERLLNALFDKINTSLQDLLSALDKAVPTATLASDRGRRIFGALRAEESAKEKEWEEKGWAQWLRDAPGPKGRQLRRDLELTKASAEAVVGVWEALEGTRESLLSYRDNVGFFKAGVVGFHLSGHGLTVEEEMSSLQSVVGEMRTALAEARGRTGAWRSKRPNALPAPPKG